MDENKLGFVYESSALGISVKMDFKTFEINKRKFSDRKFLES